jgi:hypothetical protein
MGRVRGPAVDADLSLGLRISRHTKHAVPCWSLRPTMRSALFAVSPYCTVLVCAWLLFVDTGFCWSIPLNSMFPDPSFSALHREFSILLPSSRYYCTTYSTVQYSAGGNKC